MTALEFFSQQVLILDNSLMASAMGFPNWYNLSHWSYHHSLRACFEKFHSLPLKKKKKLRHICVHSLTFSSDLEPWKTFLSIHPSVWNLDLQVSEVKIKDELYIRKFCSHSYSYFHHQLITVSINFFFLPVFMQMPKYKHIFLFFLFWPLYREGN